MKKFDYIEAAKKIFEIESRVVSELSDQLDESYDLLCEDILKMGGKLILMGIGKSGHVSQKIAATLASTGTASFFIHPTEAAHGDMGLIEKNDIVLLISNSGETDEIINIIPSLKRLSFKIASLTSNKKSTIARSSDIPIVINSEKEACPHNLAPTSSTTSALAFGDALAIALLESKGFTKTDFASSHPAGKLGKKLITQVHNIMHKGKDIPSVGQNTLLSKALIEITEKNLGITLIKNKSKVIGIFTDGDLRRCLNEKIDINKTKIRDVMTKKFKKIDFNTLAIDAAELMEKNKIFTLVVMKGEKNVGVISMHDLIQARII